MQQPKNKKLLWQLPFLVLLIVGTVLIIRQQRNMPYQKSADKVFGTFYHAVYQCDSDMTYSINAELAKVDASLSPFNPQSIITAVNQNQDVQLNDMFLDVYKLAMNISKETDGAFDITVAPLVNAWGFGFKNGIEPSKQQVDSLMQIIGYQKVTLEKGKISKTDDRIMLDCSAIAKGNPFRTGVNASKLAIAAFLIPYMFCLNPAMLLIDTTAAEFVMIIITSVIGMYAISAALEGFMLTNLNPLMRIILAAAGLMLIYPGTLTDIIGIVITALIFAVEIPKRKRQKMA